MNIEAAKKIIMAREVSGDIVGETASTLLDMLDALAESSTTDSLTGIEVATERERLLGEFVKVMEPMLWSCPPDFDMLDHWFKRQTEIQKRFFDFLRREIQR